MNVTVVIATYGDPEWEALAYKRAYPSAITQAEEVLVGYDPDETSIGPVRNMTARDATCDWLCFLDADDELAPGYIDAMAEVGGDNVLLTPMVQYVRKGRPRPPVFLDRGIPLSEDNWLVVGTLVRRETFNAVGGFCDYPHGFEDFALWSKCWRIGTRIVKVPRAVYIAHINPNSKHRQGWRDRKWQTATHQRVVAELDEWERKFKSEPPSLLV